MERRLATDWQPIQLAENFILGEFIVSQGFPEIASQIVPNIEQVNNLYKLCQFALQPIRNKFGGVNITSGLRSSELNAALNGEAFSQHLYGEAADFIVPNCPMLDVYAYCIHDLKWAGECIFYRKKGHIHLALMTLWNKPDQFIKEE